MFYVGFPTKRGQAAIKCRLLFLRLFDDSRWCVTVVFRVRLRNTA